MRTHFSYACSYEKTLYALLRTSPMRTLSCGRSSNFSYTDSSPMRTSFLYELLLCRLLPCELSYADFPFPYGLSQANFPLPCYTDFFPILTSPMRTLLRSGFLLCGLCYTDFFYADSFYTEFSEPLRTCPNFSHADLFYTSIFYKLDFFTRTDADSLLSCELFLCGVLRTFSNLFELLLCGFLLCEHFL